MKICLKCTEVFSSEKWFCPACGYDPTHLNGIEIFTDESGNGSDGFKSEYFSELAKLEADNFWFRARNEIILWALQTYKPNTLNFLEVGCGTGFVLSGIFAMHPKILLSGSEIFLAGLSHASRRVPFAKFMQMDARHVPFVDEFDAIGIFDVLEHIEEDRTVLVQLHRALKSDGILLLTVPQHPWLWSASDEYACHIRRYTCAEIEAKVTGSGFQILKSTSFVTTLLPLMMLSRWVQQKRKATFSPAGELKINPFLNKAFYLLMMLELLGMCVGLNYPIGGSRLIVARKI